jgi:signal transduction histidine kinase
MPVSFNAAVYRDAAGEVAGIFAAARDITDRQRAEREMRRLTAELERRNKELAQVIYVASHDLRSPLVNVQGFTREVQASLAELASALEDQPLDEAARSRITRLLTDDIPGSIDYVLAGATRMDRLLAGLLRVSRLGRVVLNIERLDMTRLLDEAARMLDFQAKARGAHLQTCPLPPCRGDAAQIGQVFSNLLDNALKYLSPGRPGIVQVTGRTEGAESVYCVEDNGVGIAPEHQDKVFELFHRLDPRQSEGEGLGLTIVRTILDRHGGRVWVESRPGAGSRFYVGLPAG